LLARSARDCVVASVEPVGCPDDPVDPVGGDPDDPVDPVGPPEDPVPPVEPVGEEPPEEVTWEIGDVPEPVKKGELVASQSTVAPSSTVLATKQYSSSSLR